MIPSVLIWLFFAGAAWPQGQSGDLRGIWQATGTAYRNLEGTPAQRGQPATKSIVADPSNGRIPYRADARKAADRNFKERETSDPLLSCFQPGIPRAVLLPEPFQIFHVVERYTRTGPDTLRYEATIEDREVFERAWNIRLDLARHTEPNFQLLEYECERDAKGVYRHPSQLLK